ncbi:MAG: MFS transporter [Pseudomonadota bacterium]
MADPSTKRRIWGWFFFDWASQPYHTVLLTFIFGPFFASVATTYFMSEGMNEQAADARAQSIWSLGQTVNGLIIGFGAPFLGAFADTAGRRMPWIIGFSMLYVLGAGSLWFIDPSGSNLWIMLVAFGIGFIGAEYALIFTNAQLPSLGTKEEIGQISGSGFAFGYAGGVLSLMVLLLLFVEQDTGKTLIGLDPLLGLNAEEREGTRFTGPFVATWFAAFMIPYFIWVREPKSERRGTFGSAMDSLKSSIKSLWHQPSLASYLGSSMLYRDGLNGLYAFGGTYALLVLNWQIVQVGIFGIISAIAASAFSFVGGRLDKRLGPKPVIIGTVWGLIGVCVVLVSMSREMFFGVPLDAASRLPDAVFFGCGMLIGGLGGVLQSASRSLMVRHARHDAPTESFGLYGLSGRATAFIAPALIGIVTAMTENARLGISPVIVLFLLGLILLRWVKAEGEIREADGVK